MALRGRPAGGIALVTLAMAVKASAGVALPFIVLVWAAQMSGSRAVRITKAAAAGIGVFAVVFAACTFAAGVDLGWLPALSAPGMIVNWMSIPTAVGADRRRHREPVRRARCSCSSTSSAASASRSCSWWRRGSGGRRATAGRTPCGAPGVVLIAVAVLSPAMLPWYLSWGMALLAATVWSVRGLQVMIVLSLMLIIVYYPNGEDGLYNWGYLAACLGLAVLAAASLVRVDPLRLGARKPAPAGGAAAPVAAVAEPAVETSVAEQRAG